MHAIVLDLASSLAAADPTCIPCTRTGGSLAVLIAALVGGGWMLSELVGALRTRRIRRMADTADTP